MNWNLVLEMGNSWYDRVVTAAKILNRQEREQAYDRIDSDLSQLVAKDKIPSVLVGGIVSRNHRSKIYTALLLLQWLPATQALTSAEDRALSRTDLTRVAAALAVYRAQHGAYPEQLVELVPKILSEMPLDLYTDEPLIYARKQDGGYLLYSVFENSLDDGGTDFSGEIIDGEWVGEVPEEFDSYSGGHDLVIRIPKPEFRMPEPPWD